MTISILVVEDNADNMKLFRWTLEDAGYEVTGAASAEDGFEVLNQRSFDLIVMDISLPGMDGKEATRRLRADPLYARLPIIAATAHAITEEANAILACGVTSLVTKPIDEEAFLSEIESCLHTTT
ncbi:response regulator [Lignipirellula cremea]|uniref:Polar-differentiation response regulator DivK n=1 Tax=Lignipirellula cremea TaxID=2528010 RepID=A0A518DVT2_9BACT|nr:response regulator [Lignipirellula cremea]QDU95946.1 Polar-differentiation response regulator DivK [Lignipirellula cremea]